MTFKLPDIDWGDLANKVVTLINDGAPIVEAIEPAWAPAIQVATRLLTGAVAEEPTALKIIENIQSGQAPAPDDLKGFFDDYEADYQALHADLAAQIAASSTAGAETGGAVGQAGSPGQ